MSSRFGKSGKLQLSKKRKKNKGTNLKEWRKGIKEGGNSGEGSSTFRKFTKKKIKGRRIVDFNYFLTELLKLNEHSDSGCNLNDILIVTEKTTGLLSCFHCECQKCDFTKIIWSEDPEENNINSDVVTGMTSIGCGFRKMHDLLSKMNLPTLTGTLYSNEYNKLSEELELAEEEMEILAADDVDLDDSFSCDDTYEERREAPEDELTSEEQEVGLNRMAAEQETNVSMAKDLVFEHRDGIIDDEQEAGSDRITVKQETDMSMDSVVVHQDGKSAEQETYIFSCKIEVEGKTEETLNEITVAEQEAESESMAAEKETSISIDKYLNAGHQDGRADFLIDDEQGAGSDRMRVKQETDMSMDKDLIVVHQDGKSAEQETSTLSCKIEIEDKTDGTANEITVAGQEAESESMAAEQKLEIFIEKELAVENQDGSGGVTVEQETSIYDENIAAHHKLVSQQDMEEPVNEDTVDENGTKKNGKASSVTVGKGTKRSCRTFNSSSLLGEDYENFIKWNTDSKRSRMERDFCCEDCSRYFLHQNSNCRKDLQVSSSSTVTIQTSMDILNASNQKLLNLSTLGTSKVVHCRLEELKLAMANKISAMKSALKTAKDVNNMIHFQSSARLQRELHFEAYKEAKTWEKALMQAKRLSRRLVASDLKTTALSKAQTSSVMEKRAEQKLKIAACKQRAAFEAAVEATTRQDLALVELVKALVEDESKRSVSSPRALQETLLQDQEVCDETSSEIMESKTQNSEARIAEHANESTTTSSTQQEIQFRYLFQ